MAKINATYGAGYYIDPSINYAQVEEAQRREGKKNRAAGVSAVMRQTFAAPFTIICTQCDGRTARGTHQYVNRKKSGEKFMGMPIWEIEFRCQHCMKYFCIITDWETPKVTGGYKCTKNCKRPESDEFVARNLANEALIAERKQAVENETLGGAGNMDALAKHNERMDRVHQLNNEIEARLAERQQLELQPDSFVDASVDDMDDPLDVNYGISSTKASQRQSRSLHGRLAEQIRAKRAREESGEASDIDGVVGAVDDDDDDDGSFAAFQSMLTDNNNERHTSKQSSPLPNENSLEAAPPPPVEDVGTPVVLDLKRLLSSAASNPFCVTFDDDGDDEGQRPPIALVSSDSDCNESGSVVVLKKKRGKASSLFAQFN